MKPVGTYVMVPDSLVSSKLSIAEKIVWIALAHYANEAGECWPAVATIAKFAGVSDRTVQRALTLLAKKSWVTTCHPPNIKTTAYHIKIPHGCQNVTGDTLSPLGVSECHPPGVTLSPELISNELDPFELHKTPPVPKTRKARVTFDRQAGQFIGLSEDLQSKLRSTYPGVDLPQVIREAQLWATDNRRTDYWGSLKAFCEHSLKGGIHGNHQGRGYRPSIEDAVFTGEDFIRDPHS